MSPHFSLFDEISPSPFILFVSIYPLPLPTSAFPAQFIASPFGQNSPLYDSLLNTPAYREEAYAFCMFGNVSCTITTFTSFDTSYPEVKGQGDNKSFFLLYYVDSFYSFLSLPYLSLIISLHPLSSSSPHLVADLQVLFPSPHGRLFRLLLHLPGQLEQSRPKPLHGPHGELSEMYHLHL